jgi:hypothetical protein
MNAIQLNGLQYNSHSTNDRMAASQVPGNLKKFVSQANYLGGPRSHPSSEILPGVRNLERYLLKFGLSILVAHFYPYYFRHFSEWLFSESIRSVPGVRHVIFNGNCLTMMRG